MADKKRVSRAPRGYRILLWADGFYHVYFGGECIDEVLSRWAGIAVCKKHKAAQHTLAGGQGLCHECDSEILPDQFCMMGHWCGERPAAKA